MSEVDEAHTLAREACQQQTEMYENLLGQELDIQGGEAPREFMVPKGKKAHRCTRVKVKFPLNIPGLSADNKLRVGIACMGLVDTVGRACADTGLMQVVMGAEVDSVGRAWARKTHKKIRMFDNCRDMTASEVTKAGIEIIQASFPCDGWTYAGRRLMRKLASGRLFEPCVAEWMQAYDGRGVPMMLFENVMGYTDLFSNDNKTLEQGIKEFMPKYHVVVNIINAWEVVSPLTGENARVTNRRIWVTAVREDLFGQGLVLAPDKSKRPVMTVQDLLDTDAHRRTSYQLMPAEDVAALVPRESQGSEVHPVHYLSQIANAPKGAGYGGFPTWVCATDQLFPTVVSGKLGPWFWDQVAGKWMLRQLSHDEAACLMCIRSIDPAMLESTSSDGKRGIAMAVCGNSADMVMVEAAKAMMVEQENGCPRERFQLSLQEGWPGEPARPKANRVEEAVTEFLSECIEQAKTDESAQGRGTESVGAMAAQVVKAATCPLAAFPMKVTESDGRKVCREFQFGQCIQAGGCKQAHRCHECGLCHEGGRLCLEGQLKMEAWRLKLMQKVEGADKPARPQQAHNVMERLVNTEMSGELGTVGEDAEEALSEHEADEASEGPDQVMKLLAAECLKQVVDDAVRAQEKEQNKAIIEHLVLGIQTQRSKQGKQIVSTRSLCALMSTDGGQEWAIPTTSWKGDAEGSPWIRHKDPKKPLNERQWSTVRQTLMEATLDASTTEADCGWKRVHVSAALVGDIGGIVDIRDTDDAGVTALTERDPAGLIHHHMKWVPIEELIKQEGWRSEAQKHRMKWVLNESVKIMGRRNDSKLPKKQLRAVRQLAESKVMRRKDAPKTQPMAVVAQTTVLPARSIVAVPARFVDEYGDAMSLDKHRDKPKESYKYFVRPSYTLMAEVGLRIAQGAVEQGSRMYGQHVENFGNQSIFLKEGTVLAEVQELMQVQMEGDHPTLKPQFERRLREKDLKINEFTPSHEMTKQDWRGQRVMWDTELDHGDREAQEKARLAAEARMPEELMLMQAVTDGGVLEPWREAGYRVEQLAKATNEPFFAVKSKSKWKGVKRGRQELWVVHGKLDWDFEDEGQTAEQPTMPGEDRGNQVRAMRRHMAMARESIGVAFMKPVDPGAEGRRKAELRQMIYDRTDQSGQMGLTHEQKQQMVEALEPFLDNLDPDNIGRVGWMRAELDTGDAKPISATPYRISPREREVIRLEVAKMLKLGVIRPSKSPWGSLPVLANKPDGSKRFCVDFRPLNKVLKMDAMPIPRIDDTLAALQGAKVFAQMDANCGFWQIMMEEKDIEKTAFLTPDGQYEYVTLPFGLKTASSIFQRVMNTVLAGLTWITCLVYIDDVCVWADSYEQLIERLVEVMQRFKDGGITLKLSKCQFALAEMELLGHIVSGEGIKPTPKKVEAITALLPPTSVTEVRGFLGMTGWYRRFIRDYARIARPLSDLTKKDSTMSVVDAMATPQCMKAFEELKAALIGPEVMLYHPDFSQRFRVDLDASEDQLGAVLMQQVDGAWRPIEYFSKKLSRKVRGDCNAPTHLEAMAMQEVIDRWRPYLIDAEFDLVTDHRALKSIPTRKIDANKLVRHQMLMQPYRYQIVYKPGSTHHVPDALSRLPTATTEELKDDVYEHGIPSCEAKHAIRACVLGVVEDPTAPLIADEDPVKKSNILGKDGSDQEAEAMENLWPGSPEEPGIQLPTDEELAEMQDKDPQLVEIKQYVRGKHDGPIKLPKHVLNRFHLTGAGLLIREAIETKGRWITKLDKKAQQQSLAEMMKVKPTKVIYQKVIPAIGNVRAMLLHYYHGHKTRGHPGLDAMVRRMLQKVYWVGMRKDCLKFIESCICIKDGQYPYGKILRPKPGDLKSQVTRPGQVIAIDHKSLPPTAEGYTAVLIIVDVHSSMVALPPVKGVTAAETAQRLFESWMPHNKLPEKLLSDGATSFKGAVIKALYKLMQVDRLTITAGNPRGNSVAERAVKTVKRHLTNLVHKYPRQWPRLLPTVAMMLNHTVNLDSGVAPLTMQTGQVPKGLTAMETSVETEDDESHTDQTGKEWVLQSAEVMAEMNRDIVEARHEKLREEKEKEEGVVYDTVEPGDAVWLHDQRINTRAQAEKQLQNPWTGPFLVKKMSQDGKHAVIMHGPNEKRISLRLLRKYIAPLMGMYPTAGKAYTHGQPVSVMAHRKIKEDDKWKHQYLVRYFTRGIETQEWTTWELVPPCMIQEYLLECDLNPYLKYYQVGVEVGVWWPQERKSFKGKIVSMQGNWARIQYNDGDQGEAYIDYEGKAIEASHITLEEEEERLKNEPPPKRKGGRPRGSKNKPKEPRTETGTAKDVVRRKGRSLIKQNE